PFHADATVWWQARRPAPLWHATPFEPQDEQIEGARSQEARTRNESGGKDYVRMALQINGGRRGEEPQLHNQQDADERHRAIDCREPPSGGVTGRSHLLSGPSCIRTAINSRPRRSRITFGRGRVGGPCSTEPSSTEKYPWWHGHSSRRFSAE